MNLLFWISYALLWLIIAIQGFVLIEVLRQIGFLRQESPSRDDILVTLKAVKTGEPLPALIGISAEHLQPVLWQDFLPAASGIAILLSTGCQACRELARELPSFIAANNATTPIMIIIDGVQKEVLEFIDEMGLDPHLVVIDEKKELARLLGINWSPAALAVEDGKISQAAVTTQRKQLQLLVESQRKEPIHVTS